MPSYLGVTPGVVSGPGRKTLYTFHKYVTSSQYGMASRRSGILGKPSRQMIRRSAMLQAKAAISHAKREALRTRRAARLIRNRNKES